jgi:hypothetical protein
MNELLIDAIYSAAEYYINHFGPLPADIAIKQRDEREPGRKRKEAADLRLSAILRRMFKRQKEKVTQRLEMYHPERKALDVLDDFELIDYEAMAEFIGEIVMATRDGIRLFDENINLTLDYTLTNTEAAKWAQKYVFDLVKNIDQLTMEALQQAISMFVETPGMTIGQVMDLLPFDEQRAQRVATTEITRAYTQGQQMAGEALREEYPDVKVVKRWFTNNDDRVCELCGPLDGKEVEIDENFYEPEDDYLDGNPPRHVNCRCWLSQYTDME